MTTTNPHRSENEIDAVSTWYEQCVEWLLRQSGLEVEREPCFRGKKPDLLVTLPDGTKVIIECMVKLKDPEHQKEFIEQGFHSCGGDIRELHSAVYSRLQEKATKYRKIAAQKPYIIALYDDECGPYLNKAFDLVFSAHSQRISIDRGGEVVDIGWTDMWSTETQKEGIFYRYPHVSGLLYSRWPREHYYLSNPFASIPDPPDLFPFACMPEAPLLSDGQPAWEQRDRLVHDTYDLPPNTWWRQIESLIELIKRHCRNQKNNSRQGRQKSPLPLGEG